MDSTKRKALTIASSILLPLVVATLYIEVSRRIGHHYPYDWLAVFCAAFAGAAVIATLPGSPARRVIRGIGFALVAAPALVTYLLIYVCASFDLCL
jgi:hypothetical protein